MGRRQALSTDIRTPENASCLVATASRMPEISMRPLRPQCGVLAGKPPSTASSTERHVHCQADL